MVVVVVDIVVVHLLVAECWEWGLNEEARIVVGATSSLGRGPLGPASLYTPLGGGADSHYHIVRPK